MQMSMHKNSIGFCMMLEDINCKYNHQFLLLFYQSRLCQELWFHNMYILAIRTYNWYNPGCQYLPWLSSLLPDACRNTYVNPGNGKFAWLTIIYLRLLIQLSQSVKTRHRKCALLTQLLYTIYQLGFRNFIACRIFTKC